MCYKAGRPKLPKNSFRLNQRLITIRRQRFRARINSIVRINQFMVPNSLYYRNVSISGSSMNVRI